MRKVFKADMMVSEKEQKYVRFSLEATRAGDEKILNIFVSQCLAGLLHV